MSQELDINIKARWFDHFVKVEDVESRPPGIDLDKVIDYEMEILDDQEIWRKTILFFGLAGIEEEHFPMLSGYNYIAAKNLWWALVWEKLDNLMGSSNHCPHLSTDKVPPNLKRCNICGKILSDNEVNLET